VNNIKDMTDEELRSHILTHDYKGKKFKALVLQEIISREVQILQDQINRLKNIQY